MSFLMPLLGGRVVDPCIGAPTIISVGSSSVQATGDPCPNGAVLRTAAVNLSGNLTSAFRVEVQASIHASAGSPTFSTDAPDITDADNPEPYTYDDDQTGAFISIGSGALQRYYQSRFRIIAFPSNTACGGFTTATELNLGSSVEEC